MSEAASAGLVRASREARPRLMMAQGHKRRGFVAALLHRLSGVALAIFLPMHFLALATSLQGADALDAFLALTRNPFVKTAEWGLVTALALHLALGLRLLAIELLAWRERSAAIIPAAFAAAVAIGLLFLLNAG
jgi:fumarate reductase subunit D